MQRVQLRVRISTVILRAHITQFVGALLVLCSQLDRLVHTAVVLLLRGRKAPLMRILLRFHTLLVIRVLRQRRRRRLEDGDERPP